MTWLVNMSTQNSEVSTNTRTDTTITTTPKNSNNKTNINITTNNTYLHICHHYNDYIC